MDSLVTFLENRRLTERTISSYISYLNRARSILGIPQKTFLKIKSTKRLNQLFDQLKSLPRFKSAPKKSRENMQTGFQSYIHSFENIDKINLDARKYLSELRIAYEKLAAESKKSSSVTKSIVKNLSELFDAGISKKKWDKSICRYLAVKNSREIEKIHEVAMQLQSGKYYKMVCNHPRITAKTIAIKTHLKILKANQ